MLQDDDEAPKWNEETPTQRKLEKRWKLALAKEPF